ncbi:MAG: hypothetical protein BJ554DRAFT_4306, partial [Olpidium bornovanus]
HVADLFYLQEDILRHLPDVVRLLDGAEVQRKAVRDVFVRIVHNPTGATSAAGAKPEGAGTAAGTSVAVAAPLSPAELMVTLHNLEETIGLKRAVEGHFERQHASQPVRIRERSPFAADPEEDLDERKALGGLHAVLQGSFRLAPETTFPVPALQITAPGSFSALLQLPKQQLVEALTKMPALHEPLVEHVQNLPPGQRERIQSSVPMLKRNEAQVRS